MFQVKVSFSEKDDKISRANLELRSKMIQLENLKKKIYFSKKSEKISESENLLSKSQSSQKETKKMKSRK